MTRARTVPVWLKGLAVAVGLFAALELGLLALGVGGVDGARTAFDPDARYFTPSAALPGAWNPRFDRPAKDALELPGRVDSPRWMLLGASTAVYWGAGPLETAARAEGLGDVEVVNLGRPGYGTPRTRLIQEQVLELFAPDLLILYTGDTEFIEQPPGERADVAVQRGRGALRFVRRSRVFNTLLRWTRGASVRDAGRPEEFVPMKRRFAASLDLARRDAVLEGLRENLRAMCRRAAEHDTPLVLCTVAYNRLSMPRSDGPGAPPTDPARFAELRQRVVALLPAYLAPLLPRSGHDYVHALDWRGGREPGAPPVPERLPGLRPCVGPLAGLEFDHADAADWSQRVWDHYAALERFFARDPGPGGRADLEQAERLLLEALALRPTDATSTFELGLVRALLGRDPAEVRETLERAADLDRAPRKSSPRINGILRDVAAEFPEVLLFDADALAVAGAPDGLVGWELLLDHCHMQPSFAQALREALAAAVAERWPPEGS